MPDGPGSDAALKRLQTAASKALEEYCLCGHSILMHNEEDPSPCMTPTCRCLVYERNKYGTY